MAKVNVGIETSSWINIVVGVLVAGAAYYYTTAYANPFYSGLFAGLILIVVGAYTAYAGMSDTRSRSALWPSVLSLLVGLWLVAYPWFTSEGSSYVYSQSGLGLVAAVVSGYEIFKANQSSKTMGSPGRPT
jgi:drug/metabolite transporter (DMT)-like permease